MANKPETRVDRMIRLTASGPNAHEAIVPVAFERMVRELLPGERAAGEDEVHDRK